jgi:RNA polymerase sigma factor (sigma-70 family)
MLKPTPRVNRSGAQGARELTLRELFFQEETPLLRYAFSLTGRRAVAEEIVQTVFLQLHAHWDEVETPKAWLMRCVRNQAFSYLRQNKREVHGSDDCQSTNQFCDNHSPEEMLLRMETTSALRQILEELNENDRQLVKLKYFEELKYSEISIRTGLSIGNIGYRLHHILNHLAGKLQRLGIDGKS